MTVPRLPMLEGWADQLRQPLKDLGTGIASVVDPKLGMQQELLRKLSTDPNMSQQLIDMEYQNPGSISKVFGKQVAYLGLGAPSSGAQQSSYERDNASKPVSDIAGQNTLQSNKALQDFSATATPNLQRAKNEADITSEEAKSAPVVEAVKRATAQAALDYHVADALAEDQAGKAQEDVKERGLRNNALAFYQGPKGVLNALVKGDPNMSEDTRNALFKDDGIYRQYNEQRQDQRLQMQNELWTSLEKYRAKREDQQAATQKATIEEQILKHDAQTKADVYTKQGFPVNSLDLYTIDKMGLSPTLDKLVGMNPEQLQQEAQSNPASAAILSHPTMLKSYQNMKQAQQTLDDKNLETLRSGFQKEVDRVQNEVLKKAKPDNSVVQEQIQQLQQHPYAQLMREKGTPINVEYTSKGTGMFGGTRLMITNPAKAGEQDKAKLFNDLGKKYPGKSDAEIRAMVESGVKP